MKSILQGGCVWSPQNGFSKPCAVVIEDQRIAALGDYDEQDSIEQIINVDGLMVLPGLIDVHTHGRAGYDFIAATDAQMKEMKADYAKHGVTTLFPTLASAPLAEWERAIQSIQNNAFEGIHLEGRYLNPLKRGAHAPELLARLDATELKAVLKTIQIPCHISAAWELDADGSFAKTALESGATLGLGHTAATAQQAREAQARGVTSFTHLFNAMPSLHHREGGAVSVALTGDAYCELIVDGHHICSDMVALAWHCIGKDRLVLISDSMEATGCPDGEYAIAGQPAYVKNGIALTADGALAGSTLNLWDGVKNLMQFAAIPLEDAIACATVNPARMVGIFDRVGSIEVGKRADLLLVDDTLTLRGVMMNGELLYFQKERKE